MSSGPSITTATPFPFFKLPAEIRIMIYKHHIQQAADHPQCACTLPEWCQSDKLGRGCIYAQYNHGVDIGDLLTSCQRIYHEAEPIFEAFQNVMFNDLERLRDGLIKLGPERRRHITRLSFHYTTANPTTTTVRRPSVGTQAFQLLYESTQLEQLTIWVHARQLFKDKGMMNGIHDLVQIRGVENLTIHLLPGWNISRTHRQWRQMGAAARKFRRRIAVLRLPYDEMALWRRAVAGIVKERGPRVFELPCGNLMAEEGRMSAFCGVGHAGHQG
ncbi:MAG: hypothetical protein Q9203_006137 [Teloschistes exilis]